MPIFNVRAPDGSLMKISGPEDATDEELIQIAQQSYQPKKEYGIGERAKAAFGSGLEQLPESAAGIGLGLKSALGFKEAAGEQAAGIRAEAAKPKQGPTAITWEELEKTYGKDGAIAALKKMPAYLAEQILQSAPSMAVPLAVGAGAGALSGPLAPIVAPVAGIGTYGLQQFGQFMQRQAQEGATGETLAPGKAATAAALTAPIGYFADRLTLGMGAIPEKILGKEIMAELAKRTGGVAARGAVGATTGVIAEAPTEVLEQAAERWQAGLPLKDDAAMREYKEAFFGAAAVGGVGGAGSRILAGAPQQETLAPLATPEQAPAQEPLALGMNAPFVPVSLPDGSIANTPAELDAYRQQLAQSADVKPEATTLALGMAAPFVPVALPDGSVAATPADLEHYRQQQQFGANLLAQPVTKAEKIEGLSEDEIEARFSRYNQGLKAAKDKLVAGQITPEQFTKLQDQYNRFRQEYDAYKERTAPPLNELQREAADIADKLELLGGKDIAGGIRGAIKIGSPLTQDNIQFYNEKLAEYQARKAEEGQRIEESHGLSDYMEGDKDKARYDAAFASKNKDVSDTVKAADEHIQKLTAAINQAGYKVNAIGSNSPAALRELKSHMQSLAAIAHRLTMENEAADKGYKRADKAKLTRAIEETKTDIAKAQQLIEKASVEKNELVENPEVAQANKDIAAAEMGVRKVKRESPSLWTALTGKLAAGEVRDIFSNKPTFGQRSLQTERGAQVSDLVADGTLDDFLPPDMRHDSQTFDETASTERIKEKLREQNYVTFDAEMEIAQLFGSVREAEVLIREHLTAEEANKLIQEAQYEQDRANRNAEEIVTEDATGAPEAVSTQDLATRAKELGIDVETIAHDLATRSVDLTQDQYNAALRNAISQEIANATQGEEQYMLRNGSNAQIANADVHADNLGGQVLWQDGELALVRGYSALSGAPVYIVTNGNMRSRFDVESYTGNLVTPEQKAALVEIKKQLEAEDAAKTEKIVKFNKDGLGVSQSISPEIAGILSEWKGMLGITSNVYVTTMADARANANEFTGVYRPIGSAGLKAGTLGVMRRLSNGDYYIAFTDASSKVRIMETMAHELGHIHEKEVFTKADDATKMAIMRDFDKWLASTKGKSALEHVQSLRARKVGKNDVERLNGMESKELTAYWSSFSEWYADQVSRWATTSDKPLSVVEKFFAKLGAAMRAFYAKLRNAKYLPTTTFKKYLDSAAKSPEPIVSKSEQMEMFMQSNFAEQQMMKVPFGKKKAEPTPTGAGADSMRVLEGLGRANQETEPGYREKVRQAWDNARDNPKATAEAATAATKSWLDKLETWAFSSDAALNNRIRRDIEQSTLADKEKMGLLLNTSLSQTVHSDAVASLFLQKGAIKYNDELHKWEGVDSKANFVELSKQLDELAAKNGLTKQQAELVAHTAFEAKRLRSMVRFNQELEQKIAEVKAEAASKRGNSPVAASALSEKAARMQDQFKYISDSQLAMIEPGMSLFKIHPELNKVVDTWNNIRTNTVKTLVETGLWSESEAEEMLSNADYVPFYREDQLEQNKGPKEFIRGLQVQAKEKRLKGSDRPVNDIFDNQVRWVQYSINRAVRNRSALALADTAVAVGAATPVTNEQRKGAENVVRVWRDGKEEFVSMQDPMFIDAFTGLEAIVIPSWKWASSLANMLRQSVVMYPMFSVAQVPQDSFAAMFSSGLKPQYALRIPVLAVKEFVQTLRGKSKTHEELKNVGAVGVRDFTSAMVRLDAEIFAGLKAPPGVLGKVKYALNHIAMSADNAVRQAVYEASMSQGLSRAEAMEKAFDVFNVRRKGSSKSLALAGQLIPFFSAYLAAQNVAYKTITGRGISPTERQDAFKTLAATTASVMVLSLLYAMMNGDDEDYLKKPATVRDRLLMVPGTGGFSLPLRADLFTMPKIITEHMYLMMTDKGYEDGRKFRDSMAAALGSALLSPTAVPQAIKPLVEVGINYDFFQGRPLIGTYQQKLETERQFTDSTSELGKILGQTGLVSPIAADHLLRGMFGSAGGLIIYATNPILHSDPNTPRPSLSDKDAIAALPGMSGFMMKSYESALKKDFYTLKEEVDKAANTLNDLKKRSPQQIEGFLKDEENLARVGLQKSVNAIGERLSNIRAAITQITNSSMPAGQKQQQIEMLRKAEEDMLKGVNVKMLRELGKI